MNKKTIYIYLIILGAIAIVVFSGIIIRSKNSSIGWMNLQVEGHINKFVRIDKSIFIEVDSIWVEVLFNSYFENSNPIGCQFIKIKGERFYSINCKNNLYSITLGSNGGIVEDKIWLRRIRIAMEKKEKHTNM